MSSFITLYFVLFLFEGHRNNSNILSHVGVFRGNHKLIFARAGFTDIREYCYWDTTNRCINMKDMLADLEAAPEKWVFFLFNFFSFISYHNFFLLLF